VAKQESEAQAWASSTKPKSGLNQA